jgi:phospholipid transport system substrate-binding protein
MRKPPFPKTPALRAAGLAAAMALTVLSQPASAAPASGSETVQGLYDTLLSTMKNGRTLGQSGRFVQLEPVVRRTFDIASMARLSVGSA